MIGRISYSLYLVHWPVIVFGNQLLPNMITPVRSALLVAISIAISVLSFLIIELPVRSNRFWARRKVFAFGVVSILVPASVAGATTSDHGYPSRFNAKVARLASVLQYNYTGQYRAGTCSLNPEQTFKDFSKALCFPSSKGKRAVLLGDSTAANLYSGLLPHFESKGYSLEQATASACPPILGYITVARANCKEFNSYVFSQIM